MGNNASNVTVGKPRVSGAVYFAAAGTALPASATDSLSAFTALGYISDDGVTNNNSPESDTVKAWGGDTVLVLQTDRPDTFAFTLLESMNEDVLKTVYGASNVTVDGSGNITVKATADQIPSGVWVIDMILKGGRGKRIVIPDGQISDLGDIVYKDDEAVGYPVTITDVPDSHGVYHYEYITGDALSL